MNGKVIQFTFSKVLWTDKNIMKYLIYHTNDYNYLLIFFICILTVWKRMIDNYDIRRHNSEEVMYRFT